MSHEQIAFKKKYVYGLDEQGDAIKFDGDGTEVKNAEDFAKQEFEDNLIAEFENKPAPDIETFKVKDKAEVLFGLRIESR
jgi:hypothetical protein